MRLLDDRNDRAACWPEEFEDLLMSELCGGVRVMLVANLAAAIVDALYGDEGKALAASHHVITIKSSR